MRKSAKIKMREVFTKKPLIPERFYMMKSIELFDLYLTRLFIIMAANFEYGAYTTGISMRVRL